MNAVDWITSIKTDPETGDLFIELPDELLKQVRWEVGDIIHWKPKGDSYILTNIKPKK